MNSSVLQQLQDALDLLSSAKSCIDGSAAQLQCVNADLSTTMRRLRRVQTQQDGDASSKVPARGLSAGSVAQAGSRHSSQQDSKQSPHVARQVVGKGSHQPQQQSPLVQQARAASSTPPLQLPADFVQLQQLYVSMQGQPEQQPGPSLVASGAAAGFLRALEVTYGPSIQQQQQQQQHGQGQHLGNKHLQQQQHLSVQAFADQADFVGLVAAVLSSVQALTPGRCGSPAQLAGAVPALLQKCELRLQAHMAAPQPGGHAGTAGMQQQQLQAEAVRWRNRALRSITASAAAGGPHPAEALSVGSVAGLWLPQHCWEPLRSSIGGPLGYHPGWQVLLPRHGAGGALQMQQLQDVHALKQQQLQQLQHASAQHQPTAGVPAVLTYSNVSEEVSYSRQVQKLQQLLLQYAVESAAVPKLLELLLQCCQELQAAPAAAASHAAGGSVTHDRCCALYRLLYTLAAGPVSKRGLGAACQLAVVEQDPGDRL